MVIETTLGYIQCPLFNEDYSEDADGYGTCGVTQKQGRPSPKGKTKDFTLFLLEDCPLLKVKVQVALRDLGKLVLTEKR